MVSKIKLDNKVTKSKKAKDKGTCDEFMVAADIDNDGPDSLVIYVVFDGEVSYAVEKIKIKGAGLEPSVNGKNVKWLNFFNIKQVDGSFLQSSDGVKYSIYVPVSASTIYYYDGANYGSLSATDATWNGTAMKLIEFDRGDPAIGITT